MMNDRMIKKESLNVIGIISMSIAPISALLLIGLGFYAMLNPANATIIIERWNGLIYGLVVTMITGFMIATITHG